MHIFEGTKDVYLFCYDDYFDIDQVATCVEILWGGQKVVNRYKRKSNIKRRIICLHKAPMVLTSYQT
jgi:hypothetical protein